MTEYEALEKMAEDIQLLNMSENTMRNYTRNVRSFLAFVQRPLEELDEIDVRNYIKHLINERELMPKSVNQCNAAIRFFFAVTLNRTMNYLQMPLMKVPKELPDILSREETQKLLSVSENQKHTARLLLAYGSGLRVSEIASLRVSDIDSKEMRIFVKAGKNKRDRYTILPERTLFALRSYWRRYRPASPEGWLFPGSKNVGHITTRAIACAFDSCVSKAGICKKVSIHSLRHGFATHLLENGANLLQIKELLGHSSLNSTMIYLHLANRTKGILSPADLLEKPND